MKSMDCIAQAKKHSIVRDLPSPDFFEGALLGNGGLGVVVCSRPDAIVFYLGHNSIWDIRICEDHKKYIGTFDKIWNRICSSEKDVHGEQWYQDYVRNVTSSYSTKSYPRPYPASAVYLFYDRKKYEFLQHELDISNGVVTLTFRDFDNRLYTGSVFVSQKDDVLYLNCTDSGGAPVRLFYRLWIVPHQPDGGLPDVQAEPFGFTQMLPHAEDGKSDGTDPLDRGFSLRLHGSLIEQAETVSPLNYRLHGGDGLCVEIFHGRYTDVLEHSRKAPAVAERAAALEESEKIWHTYWNRSGVAVDDDFLEEVWYQNSYFLKCTLSPRASCPGLFGNWMYGSIGTSWHGDYHMNYNTQQLFWGLMSSNRLEEHLPYISMVESVLPVARAWARDFYGLPGGCFLHSAYPVPMTVNPYPSPDWGWEILETPWTVQSLWWHYTYTGDKKLLADRLFPVIREAVAFLAAYMTRSGSDPKHDGKYHLFPTIVPELYGLSENLSKNIDGAVDLALTKFIFRAYRRAVTDLGIRGTEEELYTKVGEILAAYPEYPTAVSRRGEVFVSVESEDPDRVVYNCPANLMQIFPGEDIDPQFSDEKTLEIARRSWRYHYNEGGNDLVFYNLIGARLGILDLEQFKRQLRYCMMPNHTATDCVLLSGGRYADGMEFKYMSRMGVWVENFSAYAVLNECLLRGHTDCIELFPNWDKNRSAAFTSLRTRGAFLVDASCSGGEVDGVSIRSEIGGRMQLLNPWNAAVDGDGRRWDTPVIAVDTVSGQTLTFRKA